MVILIDFIRAFFGALVSLVATFADRTSQAGIRAEPAVVVGIFFLLTIMMWSGCWSSSIADTRRHSGRLHFLLGLLLPGIYPLAILLAMDIKDSKGLDWAAEGARTGGGGAAAPEDMRPDTEETGKGVSRDEHEEAEEEEKEAERSFDMPFFRRIALDDDGNPTGPWLITYRDSNVVVRRIIEALEHAVVVEMVNAEGKSQRMRVPYSQVTHCEEYTGVLPEPEPAAAAPKSAPKPSAPALAKTPATPGRVGGRSVGSLAPGDVIQDFRIVERLGAGEMGTVYLAHQLSLDREVALKILKEELCRDHAYIQDFVKEARAAAQLNHPHIVQAYAVGEHEGVHFFAMEYVQGKTMKQILEQSGKIPWKLAMNIMQQIAEALDFAWKKAELVHRDIKPDNIMITTAGVAKLADLGLARAASDAGSENSDEFVGTPQYISPEQLLGEPVDGRADIYSLGATLFHTVTGRFPFEGRSIAEIARKHLEEPVPDVRALEPELPEDSTRIIRKMMSKKPDDRYRDAEALLEDLRMTDMGIVLGG